MRILEPIAIFYSRISSWPRIEQWLLRLLLGKRILYCRATWKAHLNYIKCLSSAQIHKHNPPTASWPHYFQRRSSFRICSLLLYNKCFYTFPIYLCVHKQYLYYIACFKLIYMVSHYTHYSFFTLFSAYSLSNLSLFMILVWGLPNLTHLQNWDNSCFLSSVNDWCHTSCLYLSASQALLKLGFVFLRCPLYNPK